jgi:hypothetical protein
MANESRYLRLFNRDRISKNWRPHTDRLSDRMGIDSRDYPARVGFRSVEFPRIRICLSG